MDSGTCYDSVNPVTERVGPRRVEPREFIPFCRPYTTGSEWSAIKRAIDACDLSADGGSTKECHRLLEGVLGVPKALLTTSCTHALEMAALLLDVRPGDEVIVPSFTFVSTANAFALRGAKIVFADIRPDTLNLDEAKLERLVGRKTRAIVPVHYAGIPCEMDAILSIAGGRRVPVVEDNAHGLFAKYRGQYLGTFGKLATQSFHETKNFTCGEGGALLVNDESLIERAEIIREKGTNRSQFYRGQVDKYSWRDLGSSYLPSGILAAFLYEQLSARDAIQSKRKEIFDTYQAELEGWAARSSVQLPTVPAHSEQAYHMFYMLMPSPEARTALLARLRAQGIGATFHYLPLHTSPMGRKLGGRPGDCPVTEDVAERLVRLPFFNGLGAAQQARVIDSVKASVPYRAPRALAPRASANANANEAGATLGAAARKGRRYLIVVPSAAHPLSGGRFAVESAFAQHLRDLKRLLGDRWSELVVVTAAMREDDWETHKQSLEVIDGAREHMRLELMLEYSPKKGDFLLSAPVLIPKVVRLVREADLVHTHATHDLFAPVGACFGLFAAMMGKPVIAVEDIDRRRDAEMNLRTGRWSRRTYLMCRYMYDPARAWLLRKYVRYVDLMLFKELALVKDFGKGAPHVRLFLDPAFDADQIVDDAFVSKKVAALSATERPLRLLYFGRLVSYKGVRVMIEAVATAVRRGANVTFDIMGSGDEKATLEQLVSTLSIEDAVRFVEPRPYNQGFFDVLRERDVLLACPLSGDTPRSAWDALASGMPIVAFDTPFYQSLGELTNAVDVVPWLEVSRFADQLVELARDKRVLASKVRSAVTAARKNTGAAWLERRVQWVEALFDGDDEVSGPALACSVLHRERQQQLKIGGKR